LIARRPTPGTFKNVSGVSKLDRGPSSNTKKNFTASWNRSEDAAIVQPSQKLASWSRCANGWTDDVMLASSTRKNFAPLHPSG
jgi:hypothetical protein